MCGCGPKKQNICKYENKLKTAGIDAVGVKKDAAVFGHVYTSHAYSLSEEKRYNLLQSYQRAKGF